ncbi:hypothetical protein Pcinc_020495 [Petrolisthes cinctipes]|uniref:Uncharacterized protein n=1 Tax=Petrolisthes cinctipes TaxID=88211 RepID=A0AAE1KGC2_PETCI|nr:hypothetical protein Pcinc_020495 [Petrolisthes cinctipes]
MAANVITTVAVWVVVVAGLVTSLPQRGGYQDYTIKRYTNERVCWWNEICKEEFVNEFRCKCPHYTYCRSPGRYYNAYCSVMASGYIWMQPRFTESYNSFGKK